MFSIYDFNSLEKDEKARAIMAGVFLSSREVRGLTVLLYSLGNFFVEVYVDEVAGRILRQRAFTCTDLPETYFDWVKLDGITESL